MLNLKISRMHDSSMNINSNLNQDSILQYNPERQRKLREIRGEERDLKKNLQIGLDKSCIWIYITVRFVIQTIL